MTVPTAASRSTYTGNGITTVFSTGFYFLAQTDVVVKLTPDGGTETVQTLGVHYTITNPASVGANGSVTMLIAPPADASLVIERTVPYTQVTSFRTQGSFSPATHEDRFDRQTFIDQQLARRVTDLEAVGAAGSVVAGNGLTFSSTTLHVGAGAGIQSNADDVEVVFGAVGDMNVVASDAATPGSAGSTDEAARIDHQHIALTAAPAAGSVAIGNAAAIGSAFGLSRADHVHPVAAPAAPANVTKAAADAGASTTFARADHKHDITTAAAIDITDSTNGEGAATTLARSNHTHGHGNRGGGSLHANAIAGGAAGFMSGADKTILDALAAALPRVRAGQLVAQSIPNATMTGVIFEVEEYDIGNGYNPITGIYTVPSTGYYHIAAHVRFASTVFAGASSIECFIARNGITNGEVMGDFLDRPVSGTFVDSVGVANTMLLTAADTIQIGVRTTGGVSRNTYGDNTLWAGSNPSCHLSIDKLH